METPRVIEDTIEGATWISSTGRSGCREVSVSLFKQHSQPDEKAKNQVGGRGYAREGISVCYWMGGTLGIQNQDDDSGVSSFR